MDRTERIIFGLIFGLSFPIFFFLISLAIWFIQFQSYNVLYFVVSGLSAGILIDIIYLNKLISMALDLKGWVLLAFYLFYNFCIYGFFMGFPVFNLVMGAIAGYYFGIKIVYQNIPLIKIESIKKNIPLITGIVMLLICISTGLIAMFEKTLGAELQGMFGLRFEVTRGMIIAIIIIGGMTLIVSQYYLTKIVIIKTIKLHISLVNNAL